MSAISSSICSYEKLLKLRKKAKKYQRKTGERFPRAANHVVAHTKTIIFDNRPIVVRVLGKIISRSISSIEELAASGIPELRYFSK